MGGGAHAACVDSAPRIRCTCTLCARHAADRPANRCHQHCNLHGEPALECIPTECARDANHRARRLHAPTGLGRARLHVVWHSGRRPAMAFGCLLSPNCVHGAHAASALHGANVYVLRHGPLCARLGTACAPSKTTQLTNMSSDVSSEKSRRSYAGAFGISNPSRWVACGCRFVSARVEVGGSVVVRWVLGACVGGCVGGSVGACVGG